MLTRYMRGSERKNIKKLTHIDFINRAYEIYGDRYDYSQVNFVNTSTKVCIICPEHGEFWITPNNFFRGQKCPSCSGRTRITQDIFISRSKALHKNRYDYSKVNYVGLNKSVCIICPDHGDFFQKASTHLSGCGCPACFGTPKSNTDDFIRKAKVIHGKRYDYSKVTYKGNKLKICIICPEHGEWWVTPNNHLKGSRCPGCYGTPKQTTKEFVIKAREIHGDKYDYSKVEYDGLKRKVCIICPEHGEFWQSAGSHLNGSGCPECSGVAPITKELFQQRAVDIHKDKYDYSKVLFVGNNKKVCIICPEHGEFWQTPSYHLRGGNCQKCAGGVRLTTAEFIDKAKAVHEERYDYSKVKYKNTAKKVCIICPEHGEFWQTPNNHLFGAGCPTCPESKMEGELRQLLIKNNIAFEQEKGFGWLVYNRNMYLDFFLPEYGIAIECQGLQHFIPSSLFGGEEGFQLTIERDKVKKELCNKHGINILYYSNAHIDYPYPVFESLRLLLKAIKQHDAIDSLHYKEQLELQLVYESEENKNKKII